MLVMNVIAEILKRPRETAQLFPMFKSSRTYASITKSVEEVILPDEIGNVMRRAFSQAKNGRPGPVMVEVPADVHSTEVSVERAGKYFDGWFAIEPSLARWSQQWAEVQQVVRDAGRDIGKFTAAIYVTFAMDEDASRAEQRIDAFLESYYGQPASVLRQRQAC